MCFHLLVEARQAYTKDVIGWHKRYERFAADFINSHRYIASTDYKQLNAHAEALGIVEALLNERQNLATMLFAKPALTNEDMQDAIFKFNTGAEPNHKHSKSKRHSLGSTLTPEQIHLIRVYVQENDFFNEPNLTDTLLQDWFDCKPGTKLRPLYLSGIAVLLDSLKSELHIGSNWQSVIERNKMLLKSEGNETIKAKALSGALSQARLSGSSRMLKVHSDVETLCRKLYETATLGKESKHP